MIRLLYVELVGLIQVTPEERYNWKYLLRMSNLTKYIPSHTIVNQKLEYFQNLKLADHAYHKPSHIDIILGADIFPHCTLDRKQSHPPGSPTAVHTIFG